MGSQVGWACSFCSFSGSLGKASNPLPHTFSPHLLALICEPHHLLHSLPSPCHLLLFSTGSDSESDEEVTGKKSFSAQVFLCPTLGIMGQCWAFLGWTDFPAEGRPRPECKLVTVYWSVCPATGRSGPLTCPVPGGDSGTAANCTGHRARASNLYPTRSWAGLWEGCGMGGERTDLEHKEQGP